MDDRDLEQLAAKYKIQAFENQSQGGVNWLVVDRNRIITSLISRDTALRTNWAVVMSLVSLALSVVSMIRR